MKYELKVQKPAADNFHSNIPQRLNPATKQCIQNVNLKFLQSVVDNAINQHDVEFTPSG